MFCTQCGRDLRDDDTFCSRCGIRLEGIGPVPHPRLTLDKANKKVAGVCAGFARYYHTDVTLMRILWLAVAICTGIGFIAYIAAWVVLPSDGGRQADTTLVRA